MFWSLGTPHMSYQSNEIPGIVENKGTVVRAQVVQPVQAQVVQGQVVQAQVVGQPMHVVGQTGVVYQPMLQVPGYGDHMGWQEDQEAAQQAWVLYGIGCFLCWCFGPCGPCFWYFVACKHFCKPAAEQKRLQQERTVACVSLWTAVFSSLAIVAIFIFYVAVVASAASSSTTYSSSSYYDYCPRSYYHSYSP
eukprot:TRINITY_DN28848_c1_g1_i1.p1 TRINITY_DN28848_c1_g1~~TRINITY_DN28848_c1_g1_i1.p1  ORF type:complete len:192 (-),score=10.64 TRINITY_DN28848_c1_g1_i1:163-738(-)